jgi:predicted PurR-regulated permease PerM
MQWLGGASARWLAGLFGGIVQILGVAVLPILTYYLLAERKDIRESVLDFIPEGAHVYVAAARRAARQALRSYVRGQGLVCLIMGATTGIVLAAFGYPVALLLGVIAGLAEVVPYLGATTAALAIALAGSTQGLTRALIGVVIYAVLNQLLGLFVTPRVLGKHLKMHPFVVMVSILAGGQLLGPAGALLALPGAAIAQALIGELAPQRGRHATRAAEREDKAS